MENSKTTLTASMSISLVPARTFEIFVDELVLALRQAGIDMKAAPDGQLIQDDFAVGRVVAWLPGERISIQWHQASWQPEELTEVEIQFEPVDGGTRVTFSHHQWGGLLNGADELLGWFASSAVTPLLQATTPTGFGNWLTDRRARRPSGGQAREVYRDPLYHYPNFYAILAELQLSAADYLIEVGCGGGAFLREALKSGCRAAAFDHSPDMVRLAQEVNNDAIVQGRLTIKQASAEAVPFPDATFTCAVMTGVFGFLPDPVAALRELHRVLRPGGHLVLMGSDPLWRGTPAAPEPMASRLHFYQDDELRQLARDAGFANAEVVRRDLLPFAIQAGLPEEVTKIFAGPGAPFLLTRKDT